MRTVAIVQARLCSSRLPAKVALDLGGATALERCLRRVSRVRGVDDVIVATSTRAEDDLIVALASRLGFSASRGSETDVMGRYLDAARATNADIVLRFTSDCPLIDPAISARVLSAFASNAALAPRDYASNVLNRHLPRGLDTEVFSTAALFRASTTASRAEREHVTLHMYRNRHRFRCVSVVYPTQRDLSHHRWTLDTLDDYRFLATLFEILGARAADASMEEILGVVDARPNLAAINAGITQKVA